MWFPLNFTNMRMVTKTQVWKQKKPVNTYLQAFVELRGFEPRTFALPARRSSQLSYSPKSYKGDKNKYFIFQFTPQIKTTFLLLTQRIKPRMLSAYNILVMNFLYS